MFRAVVAGVFCVLASASARAGEFTCAQGKSADTVIVMASPQAFVGHCLRLRGLLRVAPKIGVTLSPIPPSSEPARVIAVYFENNDAPQGLTDRSLYAEIIGRVLTCADISKIAKVDADRANAEDAKNLHANGEPEVISIGVPSGACHYRGDLFAVLVSSFRLLPARPPG
jgi:hypothetical protein